MEKQAYHNKSYKNISSLESRLLGAVSESGIVVFGSGELKKITKLQKSTIANLLASLCKKKILLRLFRNKYCIAENVPEKGFSIATALFAPCYISFWSALSHYGFTTQQPGTIQVAATRQPKKIILPEIRIFPATIKPKSFFGYKTVNGFSIALPEKALVDSATHFRHAGGIREFAACLAKAWRTIDKNQFFDFLEKTGNKSLNSRIGYLIETMGLPAAKKQLDCLEKKAPKGFVRLNPQKKASKEYDKKWKLNINEKIEKEKVF